MVTDGLVVMRVVADALVVVRVVADSLVLWVLDSCIC